MNKYSRAFFDCLEGVSNRIDDLVWNIRQLFATGFGHYYLFVLTGISHFRYLDQLSEVIDIAEYMADKYPEYECHKHNLIVLVEHYNREKYFWMKRK